MALDIALIPPVGHNKIGGKASVAQHGSILRAGTNATAGAGYRDFSLDEGMMESILILSLPQGVS